MWSINLQEKKTVALNLHIWLWSTIFSYSTRKSKSIKEKKTNCAVRQACKYIYSSKDNFWSSMCVLLLHRLYHLVASHLCMMAAEVLKRKVGQWNKQTRSISTVCNLAIRGAMLRLDANKVSKTQWFHFMRQCIWLLLQKASLGDCYCKC